jgi:multidrug efflux pump subunit AcrB
VWIVRLALRRPYTFTVAAILIVLMGIVTITRMATDIFPKIDIPVVSVIWSFPGVAPEEMEKRFVTVTERAMTTTVNDIEHIESQSYNGVSVIKVFFHEGAKVDVGRDFGTQIEVLNGLKENTKVVMNPSDDLDEGIEVQVKPVEKPKPAGTVAQSASNR